MKKTLLILILALFSLNSFSQKSIWTKTSEDRTNSLEKMERESFPVKFHLFNLDLNAFKQLMLNAPMETVSNSDLIVDLPNSEGNLSKFKIFEAPIMEKGLADKFPDIKSYVAIGVDNPSIRLRFSVTLFGLHVMSTSGEIYYIDTYTKDLNTYIVYKRKDIQSVRTFACHFQDDAEEIAEFHRNSLPTQTYATDGKFRQYRLAMACTIEYAAYHVNAAGLASGTTAQKKAAVLSAMVVTMTRVNGVYERDMSLRMNLVANNDVIIFIDTDSFNNTSASTLINQSQTVIDANIGAANYDIGHTVSTGGGGLAGLGVVCTTSKARGITGSSAPVGDPYDIDYVAHEMGHQFGGPHTFSGTGGNCNGNGSSANAVEPASGSTIMAYAGICGPDVQSNSDPYFHAASIASMNAVMIGTGNCAPQTNNGNTPPTITALNNYTIPNGTAFVLTGSASDVNTEASLTYCWEQTNAASGTDYPTSTQTTGPVYRSFNPTISNKRYFPNFESVLGGNLFPTWEVTPTVARTLNFALTVRDNQTPTGGQTARANMTVTVASVGPFNVTSPVSGASWDTNSSQTITWNVAGTTGNGINTANVNILLSTDNGATFTTLVANTPNDGTQTVTMPSTPAPYCRIMIEAVGNIFYAVSPSFSIGYTITSSCNTYTGSAMPITTSAGFPTNQIGTITVPSTVTGTVSSISVFNNITHTYLSDVVTDLSSPQNPTTFVKVYNRLCGATNGTLNLKHIDGGATVNCSGGATLQTVASGESLATFNGQNPQGNWTFRVYDVYTGDNGTLNSWSVEICTQTTVLTNESFEIENITLYPNPNNGNFNVQFNSSTDDVKINVHDLRGRVILTKEIKATGLVNEQISLTNAQAGIYLVTIEDGAKKTTKKIIVE